jgi:hypothetical protein
VIRNFTDYGIEINGSHGTQVLGNYIGTQVTGMSASGNGTGILVTGSNGAVCTKPKDTEYRCTLDNSGSGTITFSNYTTEVQNNRVDPAAGGIVIDDCLLSEYVSYSFSGITSDKAMNVTIRKDGNGNCSS